MKILKIENGRGYYYINNQSFPICNIGKDDLFELLKYIYINNNYELDAVDENKQINNEAERIIYSSLYEKLTDFISKKEILKSEIEDEFKEAKEKYGFKEGD